MSERTGIGWAHHTFNPWWGCFEISPGCDHCYAKREAERYGHHGLWGADAPRWEMSASYWGQPHRWNRKAELAGERRRVFCGSHCDVMEDGAYLQSIRERLFPLIEATPWLDWLLLTKRPQNFRKCLPATWVENPLPNVIGMTTVESAEFVWRARKLLDTPFLRRGLSLEPLLGRVDLEPYLSRLSWVIVGGESGSFARPCDVAWIRSVIQACAAAGVPCFVKQLGALPVAQPGSQPLRLMDRKGADCSEWLEGLCVQQFPAELRAKVSM